MVVGSDGGGGDGGCDGDGRCLAVNPGTGSLSVFTARFSQLFFFFCFKKTKQTCFILMWK